MSRAGFTASSGNVAQAFRPAKPTATVAEAFRPAKPTATVAQAFRPAKSTATVAQAFRPAKSTATVAQAFRPAKALVFVVVFAFAAPAAAQEARQIAEEAQRRTDAASQHYEGTLQVIDAGGRTTDKRWRFDRLGSHGGSKAVLRFTAPAEVKGVALLVVNHTDRASDQWMWTPAIQRERRIALQDRSTRFFGTDFSFEDLEERDVSQFDYRTIAEESIEAVACWKLESRPKQTKSSQYTYSYVWIRKDIYAFVLIESYMKDRLVRRLKYADMQNVQGIWTARLLEMTDLRRNSRTILRLEKLQYNAPMKDEDFTLQALRREQ